VKVRLGIARDAFLASTGGMAGTVSGAGGLGGAAVTVACQGQRVCSDVQGVHSASPAARKEWRFQGSSVFSHPLYVQTRPQLRKEETPSVATIRALLRTPERQCRRLGAESGRTQRAGPGRMQARPGIPWCCMRTGAQSGRGQQLWHCACPRPGTSAGWAAPRARRRHTAPRPCTAARLRLRRGLPALIPGWVSPIALHTAYRSCTSSGRGVRHTGRRRDHHLERDVRALHNRARDNHGVRGDRAQDRLRCRVLNRRMQLGTAASQLARCGS
jgi:hypothetical protein